jgi:hypothetical protein
VEAICNVLNHFHQGHDPNMPRTGETQNLTEMTDVSRPTHSSSVASSSAPSPAFSATCDYLDMGDIYDN